MMQPRQPTRLGYKGEGVIDHAFYAIEGTTLRRLLLIMSELSSGNRCDADRRRDLAQSVQDRLAYAELIPETVVTSWLDADNIDKLIATKPINEDKT